MGRTVGLPIHLLYPIPCIILLGIAAFGSAEHVWYARAVTRTLEVRFASTDYCGYRISNLIETADLGCVQRGFEWAVPVQYFGFPLPTDIAVNLGRVAVLSVVAFALTLASGVWHAYSIRYSFRKSPEPNKDKLYSCGLVHIVSVFTCLIFTWCAFIAQAALVGNATKYFNDLVTVRSGVAVQSTSVGIYWGQSPWLVLGAAVTMVEWAYEAVRWRNTLAK